MTIRMELRMRTVGEWGLNSYAFVCPETTRSILVDPGAEPDTLTTMLAGTTPVAIALTHTHFDHLGALDEMRTRLKVPLVLHRGPHADGIELQADRWLEDGDMIEVGRHLLRVYFHPGHTPDQICLAPEQDNRILVGDTIFEGGPGKTWSVEGFQQTLEILRKVILKWQDDTVCYPGHGPSFVLGEKRPVIERFLAKDHGQFSGDATWEM